MQAILRLLLTSSGGTKVSSLGSTTSLAGLHPLIVRWSFGRSIHGRQTSHNCSRGSCPLSCWPQHSSNSKSSRKISSRFILCLWSSVVQVSYTNTSTVYKYLRQGRGLETTPLLKVKSAPATSLAHFESHMRVPLASTTTSRASSHKVPGDFYMTGGRVAFSLCTSRNVYQRNPGHGQTFDLRLVARYRDGPIIVVGLCLCHRVKSPHRRAVRPPLESMAVSGLIRMQVWLQEDARNATKPSGEILPH